MKNKTITTTDIAIDNPPSIVVNGHTINVTNPNEAYPFSITHKRTAVTTKFPTLKDARRWARLNNAVWPVKLDLQVGTEILVDGLRWAGITEITDDGFMVCDQDGAEFEITEARITTTYWSMKALSTIIGLIFIALAVPCIHWGITVHDTASGLAVLTGAFLLVYGAKMIYLIWRRKWSWNSYILSFHWHYLHWRLAAFIGAVKILTHSDVLDLLVPSISPCLAVNCFT